MEMDEPLIPRCNSGCSMVDVDHVEGCAFQTETVLPSSARDSTLFVDEVDHCILGRQVGPEDMYSRVSRGLYGSHIVEHCRREKTTWNELVRPLHAPTLHRCRPLPFPRVPVSCSPPSMILRDIRGIRQVPNLDKFGLWTGQLALRGDLSTLRLGNGLPSMLTVIFLRSCWLQADW